MCAVATDSILTFFLFSSQNRILKIVNPAHIAHSYDCVCYFAGFYNTEHTCSPHERTGQWEHSWAPLDILPTSSQGGRLKRDVMSQWMDSVTEHATNMFADRHCSCKWLWLFAFCASLGVFGMKHCEFTGGKALQPPVVHYSLSPCFACDTLWPKYRLIIKICAFV